MNNGIKYTAVALLAAGLAASTYAAGNIEVDWSASDVTGVALANGTPIDNTALIEIGNFSGAANTALTGFHAFATDGSTIGTGGQPNGFWNAVLSVASDSSFAHTTIYLVVQNHGQQGIFSDSQWEFPANGDIPNQISIDVENLVDNPGSPSATLDPTANIVQGGFLPQNTDTYSYLLLQAPVPEPSSIALVVMGLLGGIGLIRRRRS